MRFAIHPIITAIAVNITASSACCVSRHLTQPRGDAPAAHCCMGPGNPDSLAVILCGKAALRERLEVQSVP